MALHIQAEIIKLLSSGLVLTAKEIALRLGSRANRVRRQLRILEKGELVIRVAQQGPWVSTVSVVKKRDSKTRQQAPPS